MKHRKLVPICPDVCNPTCPSDCYPYSIPPPSPPRPRLSPRLSPPLSNKHNHSISPYVAIISTLFCIVFLVVSYYLIIVKNWCRPRTTHSEDTDDSFGDENRGLVAIDHPIWYIRTVGLQQSIINSIAVVKYTKGDRLIEGTDCSICLNEFQDDEILRLLPKCNHSFHIPCIDTWLRLHTNCPVCRSGIVHTDTQDRNDGSQIQVPESSNQAGNVEVEENRTITDADPEFRQAGIDEQAETSNTRVDFDGNDIVHEEMQQMRRSISADSLFVEKIKLAMVNLSIHENAHKFEAAENNSSKSKTPWRLYEGASASLNEGSVSMKRSSSCGGRSFFSRHSRNPNSVLPL